MDGTIKLKKEQLFEEVLQDLKYEGLLLNEEGKLFISKDFMQYVATQLLLHHRRFLLNDEGAVTVSVKDIITGKVEAKVSLSIMTLEI